MLEKLRPDRLQSREVRWLVADALVAVLFIWITVESLRSSAYIDEYGRIEGLGWILAISPTLLLFVRRLAPLTAMLIATALYMVASAFQGDSNAPLAVPLFSYSVGMTRPTRVSGWLVGVAAVAMSLSVFYGPGDPLALSVPVVIMLFATGWLVAVSIRSNQTRAERLAVEAANARAESSRVAEEAVADERARIARELHDAVGHAVNVIVMQAGAARLSSHDERTIDSLRKIEQVGRSALTDLDHMLGLLHDDDNAVAPLEPTRRIADIVRLVDSLRSGGADIHLDNRCDGSLDTTLAHRTGPAAYRIVQEALTNAIKHAGPARIDVTIDCTAGQLRVLVVDDGLGAAAAPSTPGGGRGIAGMTERAKVLGGQLTAMPLDGGGFRVEAQIPRSPQNAQSGTTKGSGQ
jgi:signal transduction histidine kinase